METKIKAWWFCKRDADGTVRLPHGDGRMVVVGETLSVEGEIVACERGLHASVRLLDALKYAPGSTVCRVEVWGDVAKEKDKIVGRHRRVLWMADADKLLRHFACDCAEEACRVAKWTDERSLNAIRVARRFADGKATRDELSASWDAAGDAARDAAGDASWDAARAAARDAASAADYAVSAAANDAARSAARSAAYAVSAAARSAAYAAYAVSAAAYAAGAAAYAAGAAAGDAQNKALTKRLMALKPRGV